MEDEVEVEVTVPVDATPEPEESSDTVVVVTDAGGDSGAAETVALESAVDHEGRLVRLEDGQAQILAVLEQLAAAQLVTQETAAVALDVAVEAEQEAAEAVEGQQADAEEDEAPDYQHPWFKPFKGGQ